MTGRAFGSQLAVVALAFALGLLAEAMASAAAQLHVSVADAAVAALWSLGLWLLPTALAACAVALLLAALCGEDTVAAKLREQWTQPGRQDLGVVALLGAPLFVALTFVAAKACLALHNVELAAALLALLSLLFASVLAGGGLVLWRAQRKRRELGRPLPLLALALGVLALVLAWLVLETRGGLAQLDGRLLAGPLAVVVGFALADRSLCVRSLGRGVLLIALGCAALFCGAFVAGEPRASITLASSGAWSPHLIRALHKLSDFDGDGYSSFLGGGDCAPFDPAISPGAAEVIGDGVDNNCIGGDGGNAAPAQRPSWGAAAHGSLTDLNLVVVTIETLRQDHASFIHSLNDTTPQLRALAKDSLVFERMYSAAPLTRLAIASLFSSYAPSEIEWLPLAPGKKMRQIGPKTPWLPELLRARGYDTIAVLSDFSAFTSEEDAGFQRGFQHYDVSTKLAYRGGTMWGFPAASQVDKAIAYLRESRRPFLLWLHLFEPHYSYEQPPGAPRFGGDEQSRYDAEIWHVDRELGRLLSALGQLGAWDKTVLFVSGDHGEAFGEHGDRWHGSNLHDPQLRPAALLRVPGLVGKRITESVTFTDIAPTLARVLGDRQIFDQLRGRSLAPLLHHRSLPESARGFVAESFSVDDGHAYQAALIAFPLKLIYQEDGQRFSLFDLSRDPAEQAPLDPRSEPRAAPLMQELIGYLERARPRSVAKR